MKAANAEEETNEMKKKSLKTNQANLIDSAVPLMIIQILFRWDTSQLEANRDDSWSHRGCSIILIKNKNPE